MDVVKICGGVILAAAAAMILGETREPYARLTVILCSVLLAGLCISLAVPLISDFQTLCADTGMETYFSVLLRVLGIGLVSQYTAEAVRDMGHGELSGRVESVGKLLMLTQAYPLLRELLDFSRNLLGA